MKIRIENILIGVLLLVVVGMVGVIRYDNIQYLYQIVVTGTEDGCACAYEVWKSRAHHKRVDGIINTTFRNEHIIYNQNDCNKYVQRYNPETKEWENVPDRWTVDEEPYDLVFPQGKEDSEYLFKEDFPLPPLNDLK